VQPWAELSKPKKKAYSTSSLIQYPEAKSPMDRKENRDGPLGISDVTAVTKSEAGEKPS